MKLPHRAVLHKAEKKSKDETIVFVPFFFGKKQHMKRHAEFVNEIGYDCVTFTLSVAKPFIAKRIPFTAYHGWGLKHIWTQEVSDILNSIPGSKIIFSFSNPSSSALEAMAFRKVKDIKAWICDGGPFFDLWKCNWNYFTYEYPVKLPLPFKLGVGAFAYTLWTQNHEKELKRDLSSLPKNFPVLSIRGWLDPLVPPSSIEKAFQGHEQLDLEVVNLPQGKHLDGLKNFPEIYKERVSQFLSSL